MPFASITHELQKTPIDLYYEIHGKSRRKVFLIMGLNSSAASWENQYNFFKTYKSKANKGPADETDYEALIFDNRGVARSDTTVGRYTTKLLAMDALALLKQVGWTDPSNRSGGIHVVGVSMGGMIAQELCLLFPDLFNSLTLISTHSGVIMNTLHAVFGFTRMMFMRSDDARIDLLASMMFEKEYLAQPSAKDPSKTNLKIFRDWTKERIASLPAQKPAGAFGQLLAAMTHRVGDEKLATIRDHFKRRVLVITGTADKIIDPAHSVRLADRLNARLHIFVGAGHALPSEKADDLNQLLVEFMADVDNLLEPRDEKKAQQELGGYDGLDVDMEDSN